MEEAYNDALWFVLVQSKTDFWMGRIPMYRSVFMLPAIPLQISGLVQEFHWTEMAVANLSSSAFCTPRRCLVRHAQKKLRKPNVSWGNQQKDRGLSLGSSR